MIFTITSEHGRPEDKILLEHKLKMRQALLEVRDHPAPIKKLIPRRLKQFDVKPRVSFKDSKHAQYTVLSIIALDQPGLIHLIATALAGCRVRLISAHIATVGEKAEDRFIVCQPNSRQALTGKQKKCLRKALLNSL